MAEVPRLKGAILIHQLNLIERDYGSEAIQVGREGLTESQRVEIDSLVSVGWISVDAATAMKRGIADHLSLDLMDLQRTVVRKAMGETISTVWRILLKNLWDGAIIRRTPILYRMTFDRGSMKLSEIEQEKATFVLTGWPDIPEFDCVGLATGIETLLEYSGCTAAHVSWRREANEVHFLTEWKR